MGRLRLWLNPDWSKPYKEKKKVEKQLKSKKNPVKVTKVFDSVVANLEGFDRIDLKEIEEGIDSTLDRLLNE